MLEILLVILVAFIVVIVYLLLKKPGEGEKGIAPFILDDENFARNRVTGEAIDQRIEKWCFGPRAGHSLIAFPRETQVEIDFTAPPGAISKLYYSLCFQLRKWEYQVQKGDEWIEVSPSHRAYYELTHKQKEELEVRIKSGLASAAQAVADLELIKHDQRKYKEFLEYFGYEFTGNEFEETGNRDEHSIKAMFVDLVDVHTGEGISMRSIVTRWPTLITDFIRLDDETDIDKVKNKMNVSNAEAVVLVTKNKLYHQWKKMFEPQLKERYRRVSELVKSREESVKQYRNWLAPFIARHKMLEEGMGNAGRRGMLRTTFVLHGGQATSMSKVTIWAWRELTLPEFHKGGGERLGRELGEGVVKCDDDWTKENLIFHPKHGLVVKYPWIDDKWVTDQKDWMMQKNWLEENKMYYSFLPITLNKINIRTPDGDELEDGVFDVQAALMSQNVMFVKLLEMRAMQEDLNRYVDGLIGVAKELPQEEVKKGRKTLEPAKNFFAYFSMPFQFLKRGPYEKDFYDRISLFWCRQMATLRYAPVVGFLKSKMGMGM